LRSNESKLVRDEYSRDTKILDILSSEYTQTSVYACLYTVNRSVEQKFHKEITRLVNIGVLEEGFSSERASPKFGIPKEKINKSCHYFKKFNLLLKHFMSPIYFSKDWVHDPFNGRAFLCFSIGLK
jgi:hypothetical protein